VHTALEWGGPEPLVIEDASGHAAETFLPPPGSEGGAAERLVAQALAAPDHGPPLAAHVVPGDRVAIAVAGDIPQANIVVAAVAECLVAAGVDREGVSVIQSAALGVDAGSPTAAGVRIAGAEMFDPTVDGSTSYLAADDSGRPLYLARALVDADVVVAVGEWGWNPSLGGRSIEGELWPTFARAACRQDLLVALARRGRGALSEWKGGMQEIAWQLGVCASLRLVRGRGGSLATAIFGLPDEASRQARLAAAGWCPSVDAMADVTVASLADPHGGFGSITAAVAAACRITRPGGTICVASRVAEPPGIIFSRWRQGAPLEGLVHEAVASGDHELIADALQTRLFARAIDDHRLVLLSDLDEDTVEELEFGYAASATEVERLAHRAESVVVLAEADRLFPSIAD